MFEFTAFWKVGGGGWEEGEGEFNCIGVLIFQLGFTRVLNETLDARSALDYLQVFRLFVSLINAISPLTHSRCQIHVQNFHILAL